MTNQSNIPLKQCTRCKEEFPKTEDYFIHFKKKYRNKNGDVIEYIVFQSKCKECKKAYDKKYYEKNKKKYKENRKRWEENNKEKLKNYEAKNRKELTDSYILRILSKRSDIPRDKLKKIPELIEAKRTQIKINRLIKQKQS